jgi:hypothetical protein
MYRALLPPRVWPMSFKNTCKRLTDEKKRKEDEEKMKQDKINQEREVTLMTQEDLDAPASSDALDHFSNSPDFEEQAVIQGGAQQELSDDDEDLDDDEDVSGDDY